MAEERTKLGPRSTLSNQEFRPRRVCVAGDTLLDRDCLDDSGRQDLLVGRKPLGWLGRIFENLRRRWAVDCACLAIQSVSPP